MRNALLEALLVGVIGCVLAFAANALSPRGLKLSRNYSPGHALTSSRFNGLGNGTKALTSEQVLAQQLQTEGLHLAGNTEVAQFFADPKRAQGQIVFVDARDDEHYHAGHIPGAYQLDHYHPENYLAVVLPICLTAEQLVVYCKGGSCEDSEQTAIFLRDAGVPRERNWVYAGGFDEWLSNQMPVETGERDSGRMLDKKLPSP